MKRKRSINEILDKNKSVDGERDFVVSKNNQFVAVYVVNPEILAYDDPKQRGKPFVFYVGNSQRNVPARHMTDGMGGLRPYVGKQVDLDEMLKGRNCTAEMPQTVNINGEDVSRRTLCSGRVPFSCGGYHEQDVEIQKFRQDSITRLDYDKFVQRVLPAYDAKKAEEQTIGYKVKKLFSKLGI
jgi:hypothetical protein